MAAITLWSDVACPWATAFVTRWQGACGRAGIPFEIDHRAFPLELINSRPTPKTTIDAEIPVVGALVPDFELRIWTEPQHTYPVTTLLALEAVQAAKEQSLAASTALDVALREAFFVDCRCISLRHVVLEVADRVDEVDAGAIATALDEGRFRNRVIDDWHAAAGGEADGSPYVVLLDGTGQLNPGIELHWEGRPADGGYPVVDRDDPSVYDVLASRLTGSS